MHWKDAPRQPIVVEIPLPNQSLLQFYQSSYLRQDAGLREETCTIPNSSSFDQEFDRIPNAHDEHTFPRKENSTPTMKPEQVTLDSSFKGKVYAVTGGSSGIGHSVSIALASFGAYVSFCGRNQERLANIENEVADISAFGNDGVLSYSLDLVDEDAVDAWIQATVDKFGKLDGAGELLKFTTVKAKVQEELTIDVL